MNAQQIPLEFDILCQDEEAKRVLKIGKYAQATDSSGAARKSLTAPEKTIEQLFLRLALMAADLRQTANRTRAQAEQTERLLKSSVVQKFDYLSASEWQKALGSELIQPKLSDKFIAPTVKKIKDRLGT